jgi:hypothetical protein
MAAPFGAPGRAFTSIEGRLFGLDISRPLSTELECRLAIIGQPTNFSFTAASGAANVCNVTVQMLDFFGNKVTDSRVVEFYLSDSAQGDGLTAVTASGTVTTTGNSSGVDLTDGLAKKFKNIFTDANGQFIVSITDTAKTGFFPCAVSPVDSQPIVGAQLITANYG